MVLGYLALLWYVESGYDYQTLATAYVYNSSGA